MTAEVRRPLPKGTDQTQDDGRADPSSERQRDQHRLSDFLKDGRREQSVSLADLARITRIPQESLRRLERGQFEELPGEVYARGFVSAYARAVRLDEDEAISLYRQCVRDSSPTWTCTQQRRRERESETPKSVDNPETPHRGAITLAVIVLLITCTVALTYLLRRPDSALDGVTRPRIERQLRWVA